MMGLNWTSVGGGGDSWVWAEGAGWGVRFGVWGLGNPWVFLSRGVFGTAGRNYRGRLESEVLSWPGAIHRPQS